MTRLTLNRPGPLMALIAVQILCTAFFLWDIVEDLRTGAMAGANIVYASTEVIASLALILAVIFEIRVLMTLLRRQAHLENQVSVAAGALADIIETYFDEWHLTPAERDVAMFAIKGFSIAETAKLRGAAEGTVKSQLNAVYRKAEVPGRGALLGMLIGDLIDAPLVPPESRTAP